MNVKRRAVEDQDLAKFNTVVVALKQALDENLVAIVLFGSRARGEAHEASDWDLLLLAHDLPEKLFKRHLYLKGLLPDIWRGQVSIVAKTPQEFEANLPCLFLDIAVDGVIFYDSDNYMADQLDYLRRLIKEAGLHREQHKGDFNWRWPEFPGSNWSLKWRVSQ